MVTNYFLNTDPDQWNIKDVYEEMEREESGLSTRELLVLLKRKLKDLIKANANDSEKANAALRFLQKWRTIKKMLTRRSTPPTANSKTLNITKSYGPMFTQSSVKILNSSVSESSSAIPSKRAPSDVISSTNWSWDSSDKAKKAKYRKVYLSSYCGDTDFGGDDDQNAHWIVADMDMTTVLRDFRQQCIKGAKKLKAYGCLHVRALSFIYLISEQSVIFSKMTSNEKTVVMKDLDVNKNLKAIEESVVLTCHRIIQVLQTSSISEDEALDKIDEIKGSSDSQQTKTAIKIVSSLLHVLLNFSSKQCESNLIIETLRPFLKNCILSQCKDTNHEW
ncbi:hypothetical protein BY458DRAFT_446946 [Sporodiniella umbellata]|nr:hypothetical protein BY458DRAFT_446946 [Sporodiniella umbellata]